MSTKISCLGFKVIFGCIFVLKETLTQIILSLDTAHQSYWKSLQEKCIFFYGWNNSNGREENLSPRKLQRRKNIHWAHWRKYYIDSSNSGEFDQRKVSYCKLKLMYQYI